ncbi:MAG: hypothetical protein AAF604_09040 [Acidobacteriota bacterium]
MKKRSMALLLALLLVSSPLALAASPDHEASWWERLREIVSDWMAANEGEQSGEDSGGGMIDPNGGG